MELGLFTSYATSAADLQRALAVARAADDLGFARVWVAEAYGSDAATVLAAIAATTTSIGIGSGVFQIPGRTPALTTMTAATLDALSGGRFTLGLGVSGPQVSEGWHGVPFADPLGRTREYIELVRTGLARHRLVGPGPHYPLPLPAGAGKPLVLSLDPVRRTLPIYLAALGPRNVALAGRVADGWLGIFLDPDRPGPVQVLREAAAAAGRPAPKVAVSVPLSVHPDPEIAARPIRPHAALYLGGMGSKEQNFYHRQASDMGYRQQADDVQEKFLTRDYAGAAASVPFAFLDATCLLGDRARLAQRLARYAEAGIDEVDVQVFEPTAQERIDSLRILQLAAADAGVLA